MSFGDERLIDAQIEARLATPAWDAIELQWQRGRAAVRALQASDALTDEPLSAVEFTLRAADSLTLQPYWFQYNGTNAGGIRIAGARRGFDFNIEMVRESMQNWAGHWEVGRAAGSGHVAVEYNFATPGFNELTPAALNKFGAEDPFAWNDTRNVALKWDQPVSQKLEIGLSCRAWWTASGTYLGRQTVGALSYRLDRWRLSLGMSGGKPYLSLGYAF